jgi:hemerythrin-like domain-containing protein
VIARAGETLRQHLEAILGGSIIERAEVEVAAATYLVYYGNHIAKEDELVLERAEKALTAEDWQAVRTAVVSKPDPLFGERPEERYRALRREIARASH